MKTNKHQTLLLVKAKQAVRAMERQELTGQVLEWDLNPITGSEAECLHVVSHLFHLSEREFAPPPDVSGGRIILLIKGGLPSYL